MELLINDVILELLNESKISVSRLHSLIYIKEFIDRIASKKYLETKDVESLKKQYGVSPNIVTWGDYFQTELASSLLKLSDEEFEKALATIKFDMISSYIIFSEKEKDFFEWIERNRNAIDEEKELLSEEEEEIIHLKILKDYYIDLGILDNFTPEERMWYNSFSEAVAM